MINKEVDNIIKRQFLNEFVHSYLNKSFTNITSKNTDDLTFMYFLIRRFYSMFGLLALQDEHMVFQDEIINFYKAARKENHDKDKAVSFIEKVGNETSMYFAKAFADTDDINIYFQTEDYFLFLREIVRDFESSIYLGLGGKYKQALQILRNTLELMLTIFAKKFINPVTDLKLNESINQWEKFNWGLPSMSSLINFISTNPKISKETKTRIQFLREIFNSATHTKRSKIQSERKFKYIQNVDENTYYNEWLMTYFLTLFVEFELFIAILKDAKLNKNVDLLSKSLGIVKKELNDRIDAFLIGCHDLYIVDKINIGYFIEIQTGKGLGIFIISDVSNEIQNKIMKILENENNSSLAGSFHLRIYDEDFNIVNSDKIGYINDSKIFYIISFFFQKNKIEILKIAQLSDLNEKQHFDIENHFIKRHHRKLEDILAQEENKSDENKDENRFILNDILEILMKEIIENP